jgi:autotransporter-associated beta strand protein
MCRCLKYLLIFMTACLLAAASSQAAIDRTWTNALLDQVFESAGNWSPTDPLGADDNYYINVADDLTCPIVGGLVTTGKVLVGVNPGPGKLILNSFSNLTVNDAEIVIGGVGSAADRSYLVMNSYTVLYHEMPLGASSEFNIGRGGLGRLEMSGGAEVYGDSGSMFVGNQVGNGQLYLTGVNTSVTMRYGILDVGNGVGSIGNVTLDNSAKMNLVGCKIGDGGQGTLTINAATTVTNTGTSKDIEIGCAGGTGTLTINGGTLTQSGGSIRIGGSNDTPNSSGELVMDGGTVNLSSNTTVIGGYNGNSGTVTMTNGAAYNQTAGSNFYLGYNGTGTAKVTMVGDSAVNANKTTISSAVPFRVGNQCTASLEIGKYSVLKASSYITLGGGNSGTGNGTIKMTDDAQIGMSGSRSILVGEFGTGTIDMSGTSSIAIADGATYTGDLEVGKRKNATGYLLMSDSAAINLPGRNVFLGYGGTGSLTMNESTLGLTAAGLRVGTSYVETAGTDEYRGDGTFTLNSGTAAFSSGVIGVAATYGTATVADATIAPNTVGNLSVNGGNFSITDAADFVVGGTLGRLTANSQTVTGSNHQGTFNMSTGTVTTAASKGFVVGGTLGIHSNNSNATTGSNNVGSFEMTGGTFSVGASSTLLVGGTYKSRSGSTITGTGNQGTFQLDGGTFNVGDSASMFMGYSGDATVTVDGGHFDASPVNATFAPTVNASFGWNVDSDFVWNQNGGKSTLPNIAVSTCPSGTTIPVGSHGPASTFNLDGGIFATNTIRTASNNDLGANGYLTVNFNGATVQARQSTLMFIYRRNMPVDNCQVNVKPGGAIFDGNAQPGRYGLGAAIPEALVSRDASGVAITTPGSGGSMTIDDSTATVTVPGTGIISLTGNNAGFVGNILVKEGALVGGGPDPLKVAAGVNALGLGNATRTITVETGGILGFRYTGMYAGDYCASAIPTIDIQGGTLAVMPMVVENGTAPSYTYAYTETRAAVNNVTLNNGTMTSMTALAIGSNPGVYAWNLNGTLTSKGTSTINYAQSPTPTAPAAVAGLIALQSGDMANPQTTFDVQDGTLTVASPLTDGLSVAGTPRATGLTKTGSGTMTITGDLTYTGNTDIQGGVFQIAAANPITLTTVTGTGTLEVLAGSTLTAASIQVDTLLIGSASAAAVPEPGTIVLLLLAGAVGVGAIVRRK